MAATVNIQNSTKEIIVVPFDISVNYSNMSSGRKVVCYYLNRMFYATNNQCKDQVSPPKHIRFRWRQVYQTPSEKVVASEPLTPSLS
jgi:hypothetical protein